MPNNKFQHSKIGYNDLTTGVKNRLGKSKSISATDYISGGNDSGNGRLKTSSEDSVSGYLTEKLKSGTNKVVLITTDINDAGSESLYFDIRVPYGQFVCGNSDNYADTSDLIKFTSEKVLTAQGNGVLITDKYNGSSTGSSGIKIDATALDLSSPILKLSQIASTTDTPFLRIDPVTKLLSVGTPQRIASPGNETSVACTTNSIAINKGDSRIDMTTAMDNAGIKLSATNNGVETARIECKSQDTDSVVRIKARNGTGVSGAIDINAEAGISLCGNVVQTLGRNNVVLWAGVATGDVPSQTGNYLSLNTTGVLLTNCSSIGMPNIPNQNSKNADLIGIDTDGNLVRVPRISDATYSAAEIPIQQFTGSTLAASINIKEKSVVKFEIELSAFNTANSKSSLYKVQGGIKRPSGGTATFVGYPNYSAMTDIYDESYTRPTFTVANNFLMVNTNYLSTVVFAGLIRLSVFEYLSSAPYI